MAEERCTVTEHGPPDNPYSYRCVSKAAYQVIDEGEDKEGFMCTKHARILRHMYEPGQVRRLRAPTPKRSGGT